MIWYHLSESDNIPPIRELFIPEISFAESRIRRFSVSPTVAQCILAHPQDGTLHIYIVDVSAPVPADESVLDRDLSSEHWITVEVLETHGGEILPQRVGLVRVDGPLRLMLKLAFRAAGYRFDAD